MAAEVFFFFNIIGGDPCVSTSTRSHVDMYWCFFIGLGAYSINSSQTIGAFHEVLNSNPLFSPFIGLKRLIFHESGAAESHDSHKDEKPLRLSPMTSSDM